MTRSSLVIAAAVASSVLLGAASCSRGTSKAPATSPAVTREWTDEIGRSVRIKQTPARIVSLAPAITESLFAVGAGDAVVGVTRYCNFPKEAATRAIVGGFADPDVERVVSLSPDVVVATSDTVTRDRFDALDKLGIPIFVVNPRDLAGVASMLRRLGAITGHDAEGEAQAKAFESTVAAVDARMKSLPVVRVLFLFSVEPPIAAGPKTFLDELLHHAGASNVAADAPTSYPRYGIEGIVASKPAKILVTVPGGAAALSKSLGKSELAKQVVEVDADLLERPGPRLGEGLERIAEILHPK